MEVDGQQHCSASMCGESDAAIQQRDCKNMRAAWRTGICVLRVPCFAATRFHKQLEQAISECTQHPTFRFILWSAGANNA